MHSLKSDPNEATMNDSENESKASDECAENSGGIVKVLNFDLKQDTYILNNPGMNEMYKVVERPKFLLLFDNKEDESKYLIYRLHKNYSQEVFQQTWKCLLDIALMEALTWLYTQSRGDAGKSMRFLYAVVVAFMVIFFLINIIVVNGRLSSTWTGVWNTVQIASIGYSCTLLIMVGPQGFNFLGRDVLMATLTVYQTIIQISAVLPFKIFFLVQCLLWAVQTM